MPTQRPLLRSMMSCRNKEKIQRAFVFSVFLWDYIDSTCYREYNYTNFWKGMCSMAVNKRCPKCGSNRCELSIEENRHGCLWTILLGWIYIFFVLFKWVVGFYIFFLYDWWMAIIKAILRKQHIWQCRKWFSFYKRTYYCHDCGYNFRG